MEKFSDDSNKDIGGNGDPDLSFYRVERSTIESLDTEMLFDPFEEQFYLPSALVELGNGQCRKYKIVGQKNEVFFPFGIEILHAA
jgi:hypothetical protein